MNCAKCGLELPDNVRQCPKCGSVNEFVQAPAPKKNKTIIYAVAVLALIALASIVFAVCASRGRQNITSAPGGVPPPGNVTSAPPGQSGEGNVVSAPPGTPQSGTTAPPGVKKPKPPREVVEYLEFVKKVEEHRQMLLKDTADALTLAVGGQAMAWDQAFNSLESGNSGEVADPFANVKKEHERQYKNWVSTLQYFDTKPAPDQCRHFSGAYRETLRTECYRMDAVKKALAAIDFTRTESMLKGLRQMQAVLKDPNLQKGIDDAADGADKQLDAVVAQYDMHKPFSVPKEQQTSGNIMGF